MRCRKKRVVIGAVLSLLTLLYFNSNGRTEWTGLSSLPSVSGRESWVDQGGYLPLNISCSLLAGTPSTEKKFLTVGLSSVKRPKGNYLLSTLTSIFSHSSVEERSSMVVVVLLAEFDTQWRETTLGEIKATFTPQLEHGELLVIHIPQEYYPPLKDLKRNFNDAPDRVSFRSKQNVDYSFLLHFSAGRGQYYLMLEDDVSCADHFLSAIRERVREQEAVHKGVPWATLEFSSLGYIGKLYRSAHLPLLARFLFLFYQEMPCDFLMNHFRMLLTQGKAIGFTPSLFQHMGTYSSFQGTYNRLKDTKFEEGPYFNPAADVYSDIPVYMGQPNQSYLPGSDYFWGRTPSVGNHLTVVLREAAVVTVITVDTGLEGKDLLASATVELGSNPITRERGVTCSKFHSLGEMANGRFEMQGVEMKYGSAASCLRIRVTGSQTNWVIIRKIRITTKTSTHTAKAH